MLYLVTQILLFLIGAFLLGAIVTWLVMRDTRNRAVHRSQSQTVADTGKLETELTAAREGMGRYRDRALALEKDLASQRERMETLRRELEEQRRAAGGDGALVAELQTKLATAKTEAKKAEEAAKTAASRAAELDALVNSQKGRLASLEQEVSSLADLRRELDTARASLRVRDERVAELETAEVQSDTRRRDQSQKIEHHEGDRRRAKTKATQKPKQRDDLKRIKGIGVALERLLHKNGVYTFEEIANWTREDVERVDAKLENFTGRIRRDKWIAQAKKLNKE